MSRSLAELAEEAAERLTSDQLHAVAARVSAREQRQREGPERKQPVDLATACAFDLDGTVRRLLRVWGPTGVGVDVDIVAAWVLPQLLRAGVPEGSAVAALERRTGWRPRTPRARERSVAEAMLGDRFPPALIANALASQGRVMC